MRQMGLAGVAPRAIALLMWFAPLTASYAITNFIATSKRVTYLKIPWNISLKYWHNIENHDAVRTSPHPTTFANICEMLCNIFVAICFYYPKKISWAA
jgi:hypothetical protein